MVLNSSENNLSDAQNELYEWIKNYMRDFHHSPSIRQMMQAMGLKSPAPIQSRLKHLQQKGFISWQEGKARTLQIVDDVLGGVPIMGSVAAGGLIETFSDVNEKLLYSLFNLIEQDNKFIIVTSSKPIVNISFELNDLKSRAKNFILLNIEKPDDDLIFAIILKNLSDRQISMDEKFIKFILKRIERSYSKIYDFIYKIDQLSLKKNKSIDFKIIKEVLGE